MGRHRHHDHRDPHHLTAVYPHNGNNFFSQLISFFLPFFLVPRHDSRVPQQTSIITQRKMQFVHIEGRRTLPSHFSHNKHVMGKIMNNIVRRIVQRFFSWTNIIISLINKPAYMAFSQTTKSCVVIYYEL